MSGQRKVGGQRKRLKDSLKSSFKAFGTRPANLESFFSDRNACRSCIKNGAKNFENNLLLTAKSKRAPRKLSPRDK
jgi:hypothetical protein